MKLASIYVGIAMGALALTQAGCGGGPECGEGTIEVDEACLPAEDVCGSGSVYNPDTGQCEATAECATGTAFEDGECVPDGSVICETGTTFDPETGTCVADITGCAEGTVQVGDECVPRDETLVPDVEEPKEPNDAGGYGTIEVPAEGDMVTVGGCVEPYDQDGDGEPDTDLDGFRVSVSEPVLLRVTVDGLDGLTGGFLMVSEVADMQADGWRRFGLNMVGDTSQRQVYLPTAGDYLIFFGDSRSLLLGSPAGGDDTCYFATVERMAVPTPEPITGDATGVLGDDSHFYVYDAQADGEILSAELNAQSASVLESVVSASAGEYRRSSEGFSFFGFEFPASLESGLRADDQVLVVVEATYDFSLDPVEYLLSVQATTPEPLPADGSAVTIPDTSSGTRFWFSAQAGDVASLDLTAADPSAIQLFDRDLRVVTAPCGMFDPCTSAEDLLAQLGEDGVYYVEFANPFTAEPGPNYDVTAAYTVETPAPLALGDSLEGVMLENDGNDFYEITLADLSWVVLSGAGTDMDLELLVYPRGVPGALDSDIPSEFQVLFGAGAEVPSILDWPEGVAERSFLVRVTDADGDGVVAGEQYDLAAVERMHTVVDLMAADSFEEAATELAAGGANHYLVLTEQARLIAEVANVTGSDVVVERLDVAEAPIATVDAGGAGEGETWADFAGEQGWVALRISDAAGAAGSYDLSVTLDDIDEMANASVDMSIPDDAALEVSLTVVNACTVEALSLDVAGDIEAAGTSITLTDPSGTTTVVVSDGSLPSVALDGNFPIDFEPTESLDAFAGVEAMGDWTLSLEKAGGDAGTLSSADLNFYCAP